MKLVTRKWAVLLTLAFVPVTSVHVSAQTTAYGIDASAFPTITFSSLPLPAATPVTPIGVTAAGGQGGDFGPDSLFYARSDNDLVTVSLTDGSLTTIGTITGLSSGQAVIGMGFDHASGTMYLASTNLSSSGSELYTLDLTTAAASLVGTITNAKFVLAIAVDCQGNLFAFDDQNDNLVAVDPATGSGTVVGPLNFDTGPVAQDADFDAATGTLYWTFFNGTSGELRTVDPATGGSTPVTTWSADFIAFAILGDCTATSVGERSNQVPQRFTLGQNYPNPFNPETVISYRTAESGRVELAIYNLLGQKVRALVDETQPAGAYAVSWNGTDDLGRPVSGGVYVYRLRSGYLTQTKKMILLQ
ncbi:MAG: T9SS type A sorting domain-containing protein [bacterium]